MQKNVILLHYSAYLTVWNHIFPFFKQYLCHRSAVSMIFILDKLITNNFINSFPFWFNFLTMILLFLRLQIVDFDTLRIVVVCLNDSLVFLEISLIFLISSSLPLSTKSFSKFASSSSPTSWVNFFQISCFACWFLGRPDLVPFFRWFTTHWN